ncbi:MULTISPECIES: tryptophan halogenase family protein [unclassified Pseudoalteromonas]|uniref:tryptophan halogenase family protein n=1 Tax=unclassified Pseudoalteromonas TaxID=194690 RepID=UPI0025B29B86|nr:MULTISPECIES: tryptophan halogenase family protein [unclassified Pseudoalteromonas]MDN3380632.1 tryptophan 7-halogenase [Pseudoalteromonas sp. APC 3893]MDN3389019.1 tryptophan 7-halogenase [Pseudoalteromonas sp. APC 4017]
MNQKSIRDIVILGGGTAGWLTANHLASHYKESIAAGNLSIRLIDSPDVATVGVGEGTVPVIRETLKSFGISETQLLMKCDTTFKQSIKFVDWTYNPSEKPNNYYHHLFEYPHLGNKSINAFWLQNKAKCPEHYASCVSIQHDICEANLAPKNIQIPEYGGVVNYAYHLDASKFTELLKENAIDNLAVQHTHAHVSNVKLSADGYISELELLNEGVLSGDLFVDCSGFEGKLINKALNGSFVDKSDVLLCDTALAIQVPYEENEQTIKPYTIAHAQKAGWIWDIGLTTRRGVGLVYSSDHISEDNAYKELADYLEADSVDARKIPMKTGYQKEPWLKNCVSIGLSQGFVEPLEATGLLVFDMTAKMLATKLPINFSEMKNIAKDYNQQVGAIWENIIDFIKLHYCISKRDDTQFWLDNRQETNIPGDLLQKLKYWQTHIPSQFDFERTTDLFKLENYLYVMYGMDFDVDVNAIIQRHPTISATTTHIDKIQQASELAMKSLEKQRELLHKIKQHGLGKI